MNTTQDNAQTLIVGAGVIGLSIAYEFAGRGAAVTVCDTSSAGSQASWAGAGLLPATGTNAIHPIEQLEELSTELHHRWHRELLQETGIDNQYRQCGSVHVARSTGDTAALSGACQHWKQHDVEFEELDPQQVCRRLPGLPKATLESIRRAVWVPGEAQLRNPRHLAALIAGCRNRGVKLMESVGPIELKRGHDQRVEVAIDGDLLKADNVCLAAGPWTEQLLSPLSVALPSLPVRGQIVLFKMVRPEWTSIVYEGSRYLVPRDDGHVLAGATIEEVGFDTTTTEAGIEGLVEFAKSWHGQLNRDSQVKSWAGLRPATFDGFPYLGRMPMFENLFVATGHFKCGIHLSTGTAAVMADLLEERVPPIDLAPLSPARVADMTATLMDQSSMDTRIT